MAGTLYKSNEEIRKMRNNEKEIRETYIYLRKKAKQRLARLEKAGKLDYLDRLPALDITRGRSTQDVYKSLLDLNAWLKNPFTKITYIRKYEKEMIERLHERGYENITEENIDEFNWFMGKVKEIDDTTNFDSPRTVEVFDTAQRLNIPLNTALKNIDYLRGHLNALDNAQPDKQRKPLTMKQVYNKVNYYERKNR